MKKVDVRQTEERRLDGYTISSPCEPNGSGELKIQASYTLEGTVLKNVDYIKYLGVTITNDLNGIRISAIFALKLIEPLVS